MAVSKKQKENQILNIHWGPSVCSSEILCYSLWEYSAHRKNLGGGSGKRWGRGGFSSPSGRSLCRLYLIGPSFGIFQVHPPLIMKKVLATACVLESQGEACSCTCALLQSISWRGDRKILSCSVPHMQSYNRPLLTTDRPSTLLLNPPSRCNCHSKFRGGQTKRNTMIKDGGGDCNDRWRNHKPRGTKRLEGYLQPTFSSTPQLTLITATLFRQMKVNRIWNFCHHGKIVFG